METRLFRWKASPEKPQNLPCPEYIPPQGLSNHDLGSLIAYQKVRIDELEREIQCQHNVLRELFIVLESSRKQDQKINYLFEQHEKSTSPKKVCVKSGNFVEWDNSAPILELKPFLKEPFRLQ